MQVADEQESEGGNARRATSVRLPISGRLRLRGALRTTGTARRQSTSCVRRNKGSAGDEVRFLAFSARRRRRVLLASPSPPWAKVDAGSCCCSTGDWLDRPYRACTAASPRQFNLARRIWTSRLARSSLGRRVQLSLLLLDCRHCSLCTFARSLAHVRWNGVSVDLAPRPSSLFETPGSENTRRTARQTLLTDGGLRG